MRHSEVSNRKSKRKLIDCNASVAATLAASSSPDVAVDTADGATAAAPPTVRRRDDDMAVDPALGATALADASQPPPPAKKRRSPDGAVDTADGATAAFAADTAGSVTTTGDTVGTVVQPPLRRRTRDVSGGACTRPGQHMRPVAPPFWLLGGTVPQTPHRLGLRRIRGARVTRVCDCLGRPTLFAHAPSIVRWGEGAGCGCGCGCCAACPNA